MDDLDALDRLNSLGEHWEGIVDAWEFVEGAGVAAGYHDMAVDRSALLQQITLQALLASAGAWPVVAGQAEGFRGRYRHAYAQRHAEYHRELFRLGSFLPESAQRVESLGILDEIPELGPEASEPAVGDLSRRLDDLGRALGPCDARAEELLNASAPGCPRCHMVLGAVPPSLDVDQLSQEVDRALGLQSRRLSRMLVGRMLVGRILDGRVDQRLEDFLKIVQASDLSALCNSLDQDLARFISRILGDR